MWLLRNCCHCSCATVVNSRTLGQCEEQHDCGKMAMAIFTSRPNSHPFEERTVTLREAVKIGRSVAKSRPATNNCIFDCKVLSRNHAILWYEDGKVSLFLWLIQTLMFTFGCVLYFQKFQPIDLKNESNRREVEISPRGRGYCANRLRFDLKYILY